MAKEDKRRTNEKYRSTGGATAGSILKTLCPNIRSLIRDIENNLAAFEEIDIYRWVGNWYYIVVDDPRLSSHPQNIRIGFTVNIKRDIIMWNNDSSDNLSGGNCFLRSAKWKNFVNKRWNKAVNKEMMHFYEFVYPK